MPTVEELSNEQGFMDTDSQSSLLAYIDNDHNISSVNTSNNDHLMDLYVAKDLMDTVNYILLYGRNNNYGQLTDSAKQRFTDISQGNRNPIIIDIILAFIEFYSIYIHFITFESKQGKFCIINEFSFSNEDRQKKQAFIVLNGDYTVCGPLFAQDLTGSKQTVFAIDDMRINHYVEKYIERLNRTDPRSFPRAEVGSVSNDLQGSSNDMLIDDISALVNDSNSHFLDQFNNTMELSNSDDQIIQKIVPPENTLSTLHSNPLVIQQREITVHHFDGASSQQQIQLVPNAIETDVQHDDAPVISPNINLEQNDHQDNINQLNESNRVMQADQNSAAIPLAASTYLSNTTAVPQTLPTQITYDAPEIIKQPKPEWNVRYASDLVPKLEQEASGKKTRYIGLLPGVGGQRSRIQVQVPAGETATRQMYLASAVRTLNDQPHRLKINVPAKTKVNALLLSDQNNLDYLEFDECSPMHKFDSDTSNVYMAITPEEHQAKCKQVPIHMFNLHQNYELTKDMIRREQLNKCILAFWLCWKEEEEGLYIPISPKSLSSIITEKKKKKHPP